MAEIIYNTNANSDIFSALYMIEKDVVLMFNHGSHYFIYDSILLDRTKYFFGKNKPINDCLNEIRQMAVKKWGKDLDNWKQAANIKSSQDDYYYFFQLLGVINFNSARGFTEVQLIKEDKAVVAKIYELCKNDLPNIEKLEIQDFTTYHQILPPTIIHKKVDNTNLDASERTLKPENKDIVISNFKKLFLEKMNDL